MAYKIILQHTRIAIENYDIGDCPKLENHLSVRRNPIGFLHDESKRILYIPRGVDINYIEKLLGTVSNMDYTPDGYDSVSIKLTTMPKDNNQKKSISFLIGENSFEYTKRYSQLLLNLPPGDGKTYITIASLPFIKLKGIVITHTEKIKLQWYTSLINMTDIDKGHICDIKGTSAIEKLLKSNNLKYKVYLVNHSTISSYGSKHGWDKVGELFKHLRIGVKIYDEAHLNFANIIKTDLSTNTKKSIYLTATFSRTDRFEVRLFDICFRNVVRHVQDSEKRKHIVYIAALYNSKPPLEMQQWMVTYKGFNRIRFATYQNTCQKFYDALDYLVSYFSNVDGKIMILTSKIETVESIQKFFLAKEMDKTISVYHSKIPLDEKDKALMADIICTTPESAGTGFDLPGLRTVIMTEGYSSEIKAEQVSGRLREYSPTDNTFFVELIDTGFKRVFDMYRRRKKVFAKKCKQLLTLHLDSKI